MADTRTLHGLDGVLEKLKALPPEIVSKRGGPVAAALRKGGAVVRKAAVTHIHRVTRDTEASGYLSTGTLAKAIVVRRQSNPQQLGANDAYVVRISRKKYPGRTGKQAVSASQTGRFLEYGTEKQLAEPWMTPAYFESRERALNTVVDELNKGINKIISKLSKGVA